MCMTTVRGSGAVNTARTGTTRRPATLNDTSTANASPSACSGVSTTVRSTNEYGWNQAPCQGSSRFATTSSGSQTPTPAYTAVRARAATGRRGTTGASSGSSPPTASSRTHTSTPSSYAGNGSQPHERAAVQGQPVPVADERPAAHRAVPQRRAQVRADARPRHHPAARVAPDHHFLSRDRPAQRAVTADVAGGAHDVPVARRACLRPLQRAA